MSSQKQRRGFPSITACDTSETASYESIAAYLDGTLLISWSSFPYFMLVAIEAGSLLRGLVLLLLSLPRIIISYFFFSEALGIQILIFISFSCLRIRDIELTSRAVLPRFYAADVRAESFEEFDKCKRKVVVTANPTVMVEPFVKDFLGGDKVLGTEIKVNPKTKKGTGFVKKPRVLVRKLKRLAVLKEFGNEVPDLGIGDRSSNHDYMSLCKGHGKCLKFFLAFALLLLQCVQGGVVGRNHRDANVTGRCIEKERQALLAFKRGLVDKSDHISSWGSEAQKQDCCRWIGVSCSNQTGHVLQLDLSYKVMGEDYYLEGKMISPKLIELKHLQHLDLSGIHFTGSQIPDFIGSLSNLRYLDLSRTYFGGKFPSQVGNLTNLVYLDLSHNYFTNAENLDWLPLLSSLRYLDLSFVNLSNVFDWPEAINKLPELTNLTLEECDLPSPILSTLSYINSSKSLASVNLSWNHLSTSSIFLWLSNYNTSLVNLDLSNNFLAGSIPDVFGNMSFLTHLNISNNQLEGGDLHSFSRLCSLQSLNLAINRLSGQLAKFVQILFSTCAQNSLEELYLSRNDLAGSLPDLTNLSSLELLYLNNNQLSVISEPHFSKLSKLQVLDLSWNDLTGSLPDLTNLSSLKVLYLNQNQLSGVISETHFSKLSKLQVLGLSSNSLVLDIHADWIPPFQLYRIDLGSCKMGPDFPKWLQTQKNFSYLDISNAGISDILPSWFWSACHLVAYMNLTSNQIIGSFADLTLGFETAASLDLSSNKLEGPIPPVLSTASYLDLSYNKLSGSISFLCSSDSIGLGFLDLSNNNVSGEVPDCLTHLEKLVMLDLSYNALSGKIPTTISSV